jgi:Phage ABA sandwich domain
MLYPEDYADAEAGPVLDRMIAVQILGIELDEHHAPEPYSTDLSAAWRVVEHLRARSDGHFTLLAFTTNWRAGWATPDPDDIYPATLEETVTGEHDASFRRYVKARTPALAICRAAVRLVRGDV